MGFSVGKFFAWILVALLLAGLLGFGITDVLVGRNANTIATVGKTKISSQEFARNFQQDLNLYSQQLGQQLSIEEAKSLGIPEITLGKLINSKVIENYLAKFGISRGDDAVSKAITKDKVFQNLSGNFSKDIYLSALERAGIKIEDYENSIRTQLSSEILFALGSSKSIGNTELSSVFADGL